MKLMFDLRLNANLNTWRNRASLMMQLKGIEGRIYFNAEAAEGFAEDTEQNLIKKTLRPSYLRLNCRSYDKKKCSSQRP